MNKRPILGISIGDPAGIGPEICIKALADADIYKRAVPVVYADKIVLQDALEVTGKSFALRQIGEPGEAAGESGTIDFIESGVITQKGQYAYSTVGEASGEASFQYIIRAIADAMAKKADGVVTGPINKEAINMAGHHYAGHTEIFADYTKTKNYGMLLSGGGLNVIHVTTHVSMRDACNLISKERVLNTIRLADKALVLMGKENRRIAVAGLNAHASENGLFGNEEEQSIIPAIEEAKAAGLNITGPVPPDTVFVKALGGQFDIVVAMYHDQGHIPLKLVGFKMDPKTGLYSQMTGINATIGLPIIRTSVDHGTAFGKAGKNRANEESLVDAINMAITFAGNAG
ncbi:MAG: 4-hydroxythreonine-4-phosphate dehydrogenase PdxA [Spirochaetes bacterium]|nr:4-hydroxythreonine-4-phosphate dehydrogenase PdxA [Spirochaetota bacterium]